jgi:succinyldiaminopimelate transaminase
VRLPDFPWDTLAAAKATAQAHPDGIVDLSVGTPVDPTPDVLQDALRGAANAPGYPQTWGTPALREAVSAWFARRRGATGVDPDGVLPTIGSKELVAWLPTLLSLGAGDRVAFPAVAYPSYDVGARIAGAEPTPMTSLVGLGPGTPPKLIWLNTPSNPTGQVLGVDHLKKVVDWARERDVVIASDECYAELDWRGLDTGSPSGSPYSTGGGGETAPTTPSLLDDRVTGGSHESLLVVYSLSKQSNLAGYRAAFAAGDPTLVRRLLEVRKHAGMIVPWPVQRALEAAVSDDAHVAEQKARYARRRAVLLPALQAAGWRVDHSEAGLYLWATRGEPCRDTVDWLAQRGILVAPGDFYGTTGAEHVRVALSATDERIEAAAARITAAI